MEVCGWKGGREEYRLGGCGTFDIFYISTLGNVTVNS